jgi:ubiquitin-like-conjugating enzyme ATG10
MYEVHLHATYRVPTLWFMLHDLPMGEPTFDLDSVYRYLVPPEYKNGLRAAGITGGLSAAVGSSSSDLVRC